MPRILYSPQKPPIILAHRGGGLEYPENSRTAFKQMSDAGFRYVETDAQVTRDNVAVFFHDPHLDRTSDASGLIRDYTWDELQKVRVGDGQSIMRVDEVLAEFPDMVFNIDLKGDESVEPVLGAIEKTGAYERVCLASFSENRLRRARKYMPKVATSAGIGQIVAMRGFSVLPRALYTRLFTKKASMQAVQVPMSSHGIPVVTPRFIDFAHDNELAVHVWTINDVETAARLLEWGVDGIVTDRPNFMRQELGI
ncbi:MAG: glycerophosphodiester phosphodiesterase [Actinomycetaceae bacterium]|nr:glycerophosphodiester phosphodiesterase [Actinomycetaceae bacterium]